MKSPPSASQSPHLPAAISKIAVAQICHSVGYHGSQSIALESLSHIATLYLQTLARIASSSANSCNRIDSNLLDLILAIEHLASVPGFPGAFQINTSLLNSGALKEIMNFVWSVDEVPFARPIRLSRSSFSSMERARASSCSSPSFAELGQDPPSSHIPAWLPAFPPPDSIRRHKYNTRVRVCDDRGEGEREEEEENGRGSVVVDKDEGILPMERARVRFRFRNGICKRGKRVCLRRGSDDG